MNEPHPRDDDFDSLLAQLVSEAGRFGHREHVRLTWLTVRGHGVASAIDRIGDGIRRTARYEGNPRKYHATLSRAWVELIGYHAAEHPGADFETFLSENPELLDKRLLLRFYNPATLASERARVGWVAPDRAPFPRRH
ncbi:hypothetical protein [Nocardia concava]|uniref:hypothetical protein n=1 Tax=Nocardia concava TaxID=257281 RepID=UPI00031D573B|nr:hypothetical protein [Nocardia concava]